MTSVETLRLPLPSYRYPWCNAWRAVLTLSLHYFHLSHSNDRRRTLLQPNALRRIGEVRLEGQASNFHTSDRHVLGIIVVVIAVHHTLYLDSATAIALLSKAVASSTPDYHVQSHCHVQHSRC